MSYGCGTLASPSGELLARGIEKSSRGNGKQHTLPETAKHTRIKQDDVQDHWLDPRSSMTPGSFTKSRSHPTRLWGSQSATELGGTHREDTMQPDLWRTGEYWNVDSNIRIWGEHEVRRGGAASNHDVHRHDQICRYMLEPQPVIGRLSREQPARITTSGVVKPDTSFLECWGFDLGLRDRQAAPVKCFKPVNKGRQFRSLRNFKQRNFAEMAETMRSQRTTFSTPGQTLIDGGRTFKTEEVAGETGEESESRPGMTYGSRSCNFWDEYGHCTRREGARLSHSVHSNAFTAHKEDYPIKYQLELNPASVYTLKFRREGHDALRRKDPKEYMPGQSPKVFRE
eukprot:TRINITY_DN75343_c0_g1_i1.p1 TRINITY_DN75343_c0_g1~~TRINITY_DN75343_c0_g1_i1.p1  ORF type:complete len:341 (-),score=47.24 TRINITY_DN75343_c0_g1_i1:64-1086(-)